MRSTVRQISHLILDVQEYTYGDFLQKDLYWYMHNFP